MQQKENSFLNRIIEVFGRGAGKATSTFYNAGKETMDVIIGNVLPFMFFVSAIVGIITTTGVGDFIANALSPLANNIVGLIILSFICGFPLLSPLLGPGAVIAQVLGVLIGTEIGRGNIPPQFALPALFAIDVQGGADFLPVAMSLAEARPETTECAVPAILLGRFVTAPLGVLLGFAASFSLF
nr:hypothetical protein [Enterococcus gilvus]